MSTKTTLWSCHLNISSSSSATLVGNNKDLVGEILSRLPLSCVVRCQCVCKEWCSLISTQSFIDMYENINQPGPPHCSRGCRATGNNNNNSCFVVQYFKYDFNQLVIHDKSKSDHFKTLFFNLDDDNTKMVREYVRGGLGVTNFFHQKRHYDIKLFSSYRGLLLFTAKPTEASMSKSARFRRWLTKEKEKKDKDSAILIVYNPVTKKQYTVAAHPVTHVYCGFYYHLPTQEYRILYQVLFEFNQYGLAFGVAKFLVFSLQTQAMRVLRPKVDAAYAAARYYHPDPSTPPVISNGSLHWIVSENTKYHILPHCSKTILCFGMESEEFRLMPHPTLSHACPQSSDGGHCHYMNLLEMDGGILCLCDGYYLLGILEIYVMEDYKKWTWVRRYHVDLSNYIQKDGCLYGIHYKALQILQGNQLLLHYHPGSSIMRRVQSDRHLFVYEEYALYSLNDQQQQLEDGALASSSSSNITKKKNKKQRQPLQVLIDGYPGEEKLLGRLRRMIIKPAETNKKRPPIVKGNMVVLTPSLAASIFQHNRTSTAPPGTGTGTGTSGGTFFSIRN